MSAVGDAMRAYAADLIANPRVHPMIGPRPQPPLDLSYPSFEQARRIEHLRRDACDVVARALQTTATTPVDHDSGDEQPR